MRTVSIFKNGKNQAIRLPNDIACEYLEELKITRNGDMIPLRPIRPNWQSLATLPATAARFLEQRLDIISDEGRFNL